MKKSIMIAAVTALATGTAYANCGDIADEAARLECYDATERARSSQCELEDFTYTSYGAGLKLTGSMTCASGRMDYRLYDGQDNFLVSGFTYFRGSAVQILERIPPPSRLSIKYSVDQR